MGTRNSKQSNRRVKWSCIRFNHNSEHPQLILDWLEARGIQVDRIVTSTIGFIVCTDKDGPVALGFLRGSTEETGIIEWVVTNPECKSDTRSRALDILIDRLIASAKRRKLAKIIGQITDKNALLRARNHGFRSIGQTLVALTVS